MLEEGMLGMCAGVLGVISQEERLQRVPLFIVNLSVGRLLIWMGYHLYCRN